ncbi:MAG: flippase-like domain-containing protein [Candidatus Aegiribacteria sp.]|nr:flippase-like domain-containing protein [Candidatus Aegiribacteria sp.]
MSEEKGIEAGGLLTTGQPPEVKGFDKAKIRKGLILFILLSGGALTAIFLKTHTGDTMKALENFNLVYIAVVLVLSIGDMCMGALRNHIYFRKLYPGLRFMVSFRANVANIFMGAVTPSQSGGGPAQLYIYYRAGVSVGKSISVSILNYLATLIFFIVAAVFSLSVLSDSFSKTMHDLVIFCFTVFAIQLVVFILIVLKPDLMVKLATGLAKKLCSRLPRFENRINRITKRLITEVTAYKNSCRLFVNEHPFILLLAIFLTCVLYLNKFFLAYFIMLGLGSSGHLVQVLCIQALVLFICYFSPSPGASGVAELSIAALMALVMSADTLGIFTLLQRFFILYIPVILGAIVVFKEAGSSLKKKLPPA